MNYYERHIGDYLKDTAHLSLLEHGIYGRLLDVYYTHEKPIAATKAGRLIGARSVEEMEALAVVLEEFFALDGVVYVHRRCDREIARYQEKQEKAAASANARWGREKAPPADLPTRAEVAVRPPSGGNATAMRPQCDGIAPKHQAPDTRHQCVQGEREEGGPDGPAHADFENLKTEAGEALRKAGLPDVSEAHPDLLSLLRQGVTVGELVSAAVGAKLKDKPFAYTLARAAGRRQDAAAAAALPDAPSPATADPDSRAAVNADALRLGVGPWRQVDSAGNTVTWAAYAAQVQAARVAERAASGAVGVAA
jgi:uncharacterized protein YdaU (DUF1376 family)